jgi:hypothetical protein
MSIAATSFREFFQPITLASSHSRVELRENILGPVAHLGTSNDRVRTTASHLIRYASHVLIGTVIFLIFALPVVLLSFLTTYLVANYQISMALVSALRAAQFVLVIVDLLLFAQLIIRATVDLLRRV